jgi:phage-related protein
MAVIGDAYIVVRALTKGFKETVERDVKGIGSIGEKAGRDVADGYRRGTSRGGKLDLFDANWFRNAELARVQFRKLAIATNFLFPAITAILGIIGALVGGLVTLVAVLGQAARSAIVLVSALFAVAQAGITAKLAFQGVGDAFKAGLKAQDQALDNSEAQAAAARRLRDARLSLKRLLEEEKPEALAEARERAVRAEEAAADALLNTERATRTYNEAQRRSLRAIENLNKAREDAREKIKQLRFELEGGAISEKRARLEFEKARDSLQRVQDLPPNSRARQEAELAFAQADLNLRKAIDRNQSLKKEEEASTKAGVEGSQAVVDAKQNIIDAQQSETDAGIAAAKAIRDAARAQQAASEAAADAQAGGRVERDLNRRIAAAREEVELAEKAAAKAAAGGFDEYRKAMEKLSPEAQRFVEFLIENRNAFDGLRAAAGRQLFPNLEIALTTIIGRFKDLEDVVEETGAILGRLSLKFAAAFFEGEGFDRLKRVWADNNGLLEKLGETVITLAEGLFILLDNARPLVEAFGDWAKNTSEAWKESLLFREANGELATSFERIQDRISRVAGIFGTYKEAFAEIGRVINQPGGAGDLLLQYFEEASQRFLDFVRAGSEDGSLNEFFLGVTDNFTKILTVLGKIGAGLLAIGASEGFGQFLDSLIKVTDTFNDLGLRLSEPDGVVANLGVFLEEFSKFISLATDTGNLNAFFFAVNESLKSINLILGTEIVQAILALVGPVIGFLLGIGLIKRAFLFLGRVVGGVFAILVGGSANAAAIFKKVTIGIRAAAVFGTGFIGILGKVLTFLLRFAGPIGFILSILLTFLPTIIENWGGIVDFFKGLWESISSGISSFFDGVVRFFSDGFDAIIGFLQPFIDFYIGIWMTAFDIIRGIVEIFVAIFQIAFVLIATVVQGVWNGIQAGFQAVANFVRPILDRVFGFFQGIFNNIGNFVGRVWAGIRDGFLAFVNFIQPPLQRIFGFFQNVFNNVVNFVRGVINTLIGFAEGFVNGFIGGLNRIIGAINDLRIPIPEIVRGLFGGATELSFNIRPIGAITLPRLAEGGLVRATPGGVAAIIGEGGRNERIEPLDKDGLSKRDRAIIAQLSGSGGATINVYPSAGMNERELADLVSRRLAFELRRGAA